VITPVNDANGKLIGFTKVTRDLTERRRAEEQLRQADERFRLMIESVHDYAIFMLDRQGRVATWNRGAEHIKGYTRRRSSGSISPASTLRRRSARESRNASSRSPAPRGASRKRGGASEKTARASGPTSC